VPLVEWRVTVIADGWRFDRWSSRLRTSLVGVEKEEINVPWSVGSAVVTRIVRGQAGSWSVEFDLNFRIVVDDDREVFVRRIVNVRANEQRGRKRAALRR
jgi:hypothetical protein